jgi:hypothetical protein
MVTSRKEAEGRNQKELNQLITVGHLEQFKTDLIAEINRIINKGKSLPAKKWLKSVEVIKLLGVSPGKLQTMRKSGALAYIRIGGSLFYDPEDIYNMFDKSRVIDE